MKRNDRRLLVLLALLLVLWVLWSLGAAACCATLPAPFGGLGAAGCGAGLVLTLLPVLARLCGAKG